MDALESLKAFAQYIAGLIDGPDCVDGENLAGIPEKKTELIQQMIRSGVSVPQFWVATQFVYYTSSQTNYQGCGIAKHELLHLKDHVDTAIKEYQGVEEAGTTPANSQGDSELSLDVRSLAVFIDDRSRTKKDIAKKLGCHEKSLAPNRCPKLAAAIRAHRAPYSRVKGSKDADGNLEARVDD